MAIKFNPTLQEKFIPTPQEIKALSGCDLEEQRIGLDFTTGRKLKPGICILDKSDITIWQRFLRIFNRGKLAHIDFRAKTVAKGLSEYDFKPFGRVLVGEEAWTQEADDAAEQSGEWDAYIKVCEFAGKVFIKKNKPELWKSVSFTKDLTLSLEQRYAKNRAPQKLEATFKASYNPLWTVEHIKREIALEFPRSRVSIYSREERECVEYPGATPQIAEINIGLNDNTAPTENLKIVVEQRLRPLKI